jgi:hypothetical protein
MRDAHEQCLELLPWYVNGTLASDLHEKVERHLGQCLTCHANLREERRVQGLVRAQDTVPLGPGHGVKALLRRIDRRQRSRSAWFPFGSPMLGYGFAALCGGVIVAIALGVSREPAEADTAFATLTSTPAGDVTRIDVIFVEPQSAAELSEFVGEFDATLLGGPSQVGRYTFGVEPASDLELLDLIEGLNADPRVRFAARSYAVNAAAGEEP